jgi:hypothetical protein
LKLKQHEKIDDVEVAQITEVKVVKNDFGSRKKTDIRILLGYGIILSQEDIDYALEFGILKKEGSKKITFLNGKLSWSSPRELFKLYRENNKFLSILHNKIRKSMQNDLVSLKKSLKKSPIYSTGLFLSIYYYSTILSSAGLFVSLPAYPKF